MINPLTGVDQDGIPFKINESNADVRPVNADGAGPQFIMPAMDGSVKLPSFLKLRTMYEPGTGDDVTLASELSHVVGLPIKPFDMGEGSTDLVFTGLKGYGYAGLGDEPADVAAFLDECALDNKGNPVFTGMLDPLWKEFVSMFMGAEGYQLENGPRERDLEAFMDRVTVRMSQAKNMARRITIPPKVVETTFLVGATPVVLPAKYDNGGSTPIVFKVTASDAVLFSPEYFGNTQPRLAYVAFQEVCKYFGLGRVTPLILLAMFEAYGTNNAPTLATAFLETILVKINTTGKYTPGVTVNSRTSNAKNLTVMAILYELFEHIVLFAAFRKLADSFQRSEMVRDVHVEWYNEFEDTFGDAIITAAQRDIKWTGVPNDDEGTFGIKAMPFGFEGDSVPQSARWIEENAGSYGLVPLRQANAGKEWKAVDCAHNVKTYGWMKSGNDTVAWPSMPAEFDPQVGLICDADNKAFLEIAVKGDAFAGWQRENVYDAPRMYKLGITRTWTNKHNLGLGPMTLADVLVDRHTAFGGNIVPFRMPTPPAQQAAKKGTLQLNPAQLFKDVQARAKKDAGDGEESSI